jgi:hypothetical protein
MLDVTIYDMDGAAIATFLDDNDEGVDFVSLVNNETYGPPALVAPSRGEGPVAQLEDEVLYINTNLVPMFKIVRVTDR